MQVLAWIFFAILCYVTYRVARFLVGMRSTSNKIMAASGAEFHETVDSILESADELPDVILDLLETMNLFGSSKHSQRVLLRTVRKVEANRHKHTKTERSEEFDAALNDLRVELKELFGKAVVAWLQYVMSQSVFLQLRMLISILRARSRRVPDPEQNVGMSVLRSLPSLEHC